MLSGNLRTHTITVGGMVALPTPTCAVRVQVFRKQVSPTMFFDRYIKIPSQQSIGDCDPKTDKCPGEFMRRNCPETCGIEVFECSCCSSNSSSLPAPVEGVDANGYTPSLYTFAADAIRQTVHYNVDRQRLFVAPGRVCAAGDRDRSGSSRYQ